jgi:HSP20 family molecular chaperone IbpA
MADQEITVRHKVEAPASQEQTKPGPVFVPAVDIFESDKALTLVADLPGVSADKVDVDLKEGVLTLSAEAQEQAGPTERAHLTEYRTGRYYRQFALSEVIDQNRIEARIKDGVLELVLPKVEKAQPRKIQVQC